MSTTCSPAYNGGWLYNAWKRSLGVCLLLLVWGVFLSGFNKKGAAQPVSSQVIANKWVYDSMKLYYYWAGQMTDHPDYNLATPDFFKQLLSAEDRFSQISTYADEHTPRSTAQLFGFQYAFIQHPFKPDEWVGIITLVLHGSDASRLRLQRGMFFTQVNNKVVNKKNMSAIISDLESNTNSYALLQLAVLNGAGTALNDSARVGVKQRAIRQRAIFTTGLFEKQGIKTAYLPYFLCEEKDDAVLLEKIMAWKLAGINELILDLRYNPGGSVASVTKLAATLVAGFNANSTFITYTGNQQGGRVKLSFKEAINYSRIDQGKDLNYLRNINLGLKRVFILTSRSTASAAELLINNLKPYIQVKLIGEKTLGKDEASFTIEDARVDWILSPIIYKVADANGHGGYSKGIKPDYAVNEFSRLPLPELGSPGDLPVQKALDLIYGKGRQEEMASSRSRVFSFPQALPQFYSSQSGLIKTR